MFIDTHAHVYKSTCENISQYIDNSKNSNVLKIVNVSEDIFSSKEIVDLSKKYKNVLYATAGVHPLNVDDVGSDDLKILEEIIVNEKIVAIGEIGLDYYYSKENKDKQIYYLKKQLSLASKYNLPVIIHSRDATKDTIDILKDYNLKGVIHCFNGSLDVAYEYINMGFYLGVGGVLTFKNSKLKDIIKFIPLKYLVLETDSPYLTPEPYRKYKNESKYIPVIANFLAEIKNVSVSKVLKITTENANRIFDFFI